MGDIWSNLKAVKSEKNYPKLKYKFGTLWTIISTNVFDFL